MNNVTYGNMDGCAPGCKFPHFCGDAIVDEAEGEQCDLGPTNGMSMAPCSIDCKVCSTAVAARVAETHGRVDGRARDKRSACGSSPCGSGCV